MKKLGIALSYLMASYSVPSCDFLSYNIVLCDIKDMILSYRVISCHTTLCRIVSYGIASYGIILYHILSYHVISHSIVSYHVIIYRIISYHIISYHIISYHILDRCYVSCHVNNPSNVWYPNLFIISQSVPRACVRAESIVTEGDISFASIGTNDLTQLMYGFSRDDTAKFMVSGWTC